MAGLPTLVPDHALHGQILDAYMTVIGRDGWEGARIDVVATAAGTSTAAVAEAFADRWQALRAYGLSLDRAALGEAASDVGANVRDRLFTLLMERFDAGQGHRLAAAKIAEAARRDPALAAFMVVALTRSVARLADAAGVATGGLLGPFRVQALTMLTLQVTRAWLDDDSEDLGPTMKALDESLARAESWVRKMPHRATVNSAAVSPAAVPRLTDDRLAE